MANLKIVNGQTRNLLKRRMVGLGNREIIRNVELLQIMII